MKYAVENGIIDLTSVHKKVDMKKREELLKRHKYTIWQGTDGSWRTYVYDPSKKYNRRMVKKNSKEKIEDIAIQDVMRCEENNKRTAPKTLKEIFPEWIAYKRKHTESTSYIKRITADWKRFYSYQTDFINKPITDFTKIELDNWAHDMIRELGLTKKQYYNMSIILRQELDYAVEQHYIKENVFQQVKINTKLFRKVKKKPGETQVYLVDEVPKMINEMYRRFINNPTDTSPLGVLLAFETGVRIGELLAIKTTDFSEDGRYLHIQRQIVRQYEQIDKDGFIMRFSGFEVLEHTKTKDGDRRVYITEVARKLIDLILAVNEYNHFYDDDFLFVNANGRIKHYAIQARIIRGCETIGIITKTMHKIRKTYISSLIDAGLNIDEIRRLAGHSDERTTYQNYCYNRLSTEQTHTVIDSALKFKELEYNFDPQEVISGNQHLIGMNG